MQPWPLLAINRRTIADLVFYNYTQLLSATAEGHGIQSGINALSRDQQHRNKMIAKHSFSAENKKPQ